MLPSILSSPSFKHMFSFSKNLSRVLFAAAALFLGMGATLTAQPKVEWDKSNHDFGTIQEQDGDVTVEFKFTNTGDKPLMILRCQASCGCTTPEYTRKPLKPGESGAIKVIYHAKGRPGTFTKSVVVYDNSEPKHQSTLIITGNVLSNRLPEESFSHRMGAGLRVKNRALNFFDVYPNRANRTRAMAVYNEGDEPIRLAFRNMPKHIAVQVEPEVLQPKTEGKVMVTFLTSKCKDWGLHHDRFEVYVKGHETAMEDNTVAVSADIWEDFSTLSRKERDQAPQIEVEGTSLDFGENDEPRTREVVITNTGHSKLHIRKIQNDLPKVFVTAIGDDVIKAGETTTLTIRFEPSQTQLNTVNHHLTIISDDPSNSRVIINMTASK